MSGKAQSRTLTLHVVKPPVFDVVEDYLYRHNYPSLAAYHRVQAYYRLWLIILQRFHLQLELVDAAYPLQHADRS